MLIDIIVLMIISMLVCVWEEHVLPVLMYEMVQMQVGAELDVVSGDVEREHGRVARRVGRAEERR